MAMLKDAGDTRTYTASKLVDFDWRIPWQSTPQLSAIYSSKSNWPGKLAYGTAEGHVNVFVYSSTITSDDAAVIQASEDSGFSSIGASSNGHARNETFDHAQIPGLHFAAINTAALGTNRNIYLRAQHATNTSDGQIKYKLS